MSQLIVTGLWDINWEEGEKVRVLSDVRSTIEMLKNRRILFHYDRAWIIDFVRELAFENDVELIGLQKEIEELPSQDYLPEFLKRTLLYSVTQGEPDAARDRLDKGWILFWTKYIQHGEGHYLKYLATKLAKIELMASLAVDPNIGECSDLIWLDADFSRWKLSGDEFHSLFAPSQYLSLYHFASPYYYMGQQIPTASFALSAGRLAWLEIRSEYRQAIARLNLYPYPFDEEVILSLMRGQNAERFRLFSSKSALAVRQKFG